MTNERDRFIERFRWCFLMNWVKKFPDQEVRIDKESTNYKLATTIAETIWETK